jgi:hypothetical protein
MSDIISTATVTEIKTVAADVNAKVVASESSVLTFIKAHYSAVVYVAIGAAIVLFWKLI